MPLLKHDELDKDTSAKCHPISNLNTIFKFIERLVLARLSQHLMFSPSFNRAQSAYWCLHSSEMALLQTMYAAYRPMDWGKATLIVALDISAAFDTVVDSTLLSHLHNNFGVRGNALSWISGFSAYLSGQSQIVHVGLASSTPSIAAAECFKDRYFGWSSSLSTHLQLQASNTTGINSSMLLNTLNFLWRSLSQRLWHLETSLVALQAWLAMNGLNRP